MPELNDPRVQFFKNRFQETLPGFLKTYRPQENLIIHCDADLYTATLYVLSKLDSVISSGTIVMFDDFSIANHDFKAFRNYTDSYCRTYEVIGTAGLGYDKIAIRFT